MTIKHEATIYILDDDVELLEAMDYALSEEDWNVRTFSKASEFMESLDDTKPGCLVLDIQMPEVSGLEVQNQLDQKGIKSPIVFISAYGTLETAVQAFRAGAVDFLQKPLSLQEFLSTVERAIQRDETRIKEEYSRSPVGIFETFSEREKQVAADMAFGLTPNLISEHLGISERTIERYRQNIMKKLDTSTSEFPAIYKKIKSSKG